MDPRMLLFGKHGQVATEIQRLAPSFAIDVRAVSSAEADFRDPAQVLVQLANLPSGTVVINASAYTQVDQAESELDTALQVNAHTPGEIARTCAERGLRLIHISTDYVFDGSKTGPYVETDPTGPIGAYGLSKLRGEEAIRQSLQQAIILRTSWVFSSHGKNFVKTMLRLSETRDTLTVVADQQGGPTSAAAIARTCLQLARAIESEPADSARWGIYHYAGAPATTWHQFAEEIFARAGRAVTVKPIRTSDYPTPARRPANSMLDSRKLQENFRIEPCDWRSDLAEVLQELLPGELKPASTRA